MSHQVTSSHEKDQPLQSGVTASSGDTTGVISVKLSGGLVYYTPAAAKWLSETHSLGLGDAWYARLAEPVRLRMHREWVMNLLDGAASSVSTVSALTFCFENNDSTRQIVVEFAAPVGDLDQHGLLVGTVRVSYLKPSSWGGTVGSSENSVAGTVSDKQEQSGMNVQDEPEPEAADVNRKLLRTIGHEMQQPIYAIQNFMFAARQHLKMGQSDQVAEMLTKIERQIARARDFGDRLRQFASQTQQSPRQTDLHQVIRSCCDMIQIYCEDARAALELQLDATESAVMCDPLQLQQVLLNLVRNATDSLMSNDSHPRSLVIETANDGQTVCVRVIDSGNGIAAGDRERIFERLYTTKDSGLGMGLAYCRSVIAAHGGTLTLVESNPGRVVFEIRLPIAG